MIWKKTRETLCCLWQGFPGRQRNRLSLFGYTYRTNRRTKRYHSRVFLLLLVCVFADIFIWTVASLIVNIYPYSLRTTWTIPYTLAALEEREPSWEEMKGALCLVLKISVCAYIYVYAPGWFRPPPKFWPKRSPCIIFPWAGVTNPSGGVRVSFSLASPISPVLTTMATTDRPCRSHSRINSSCLHTSQHR